MTRAEIFSSSSQKVIGFLLITGFLLALGLYYIPQRDAFSDENEFHLPLAKQFYYSPAMQVILGEHYGAANTPLPYIISVSVLKIFGAEPDIYKLRIINLFVYLVIVVLLFYGCFQRDLWMLVIVAFNVYLLKSAVVYYMTDWGILFFCCFLLILKYKDDLPKPLVFSLVILSCLFAIMSQQFYMILPVALLLGAFAENGYRINKKLILYAFASLLIIVLPVFLFVQWGGMTHRNFNGYNPIAFAPTNITAILAIVGFSLSPFTLYKLTQEKKVYWIVAIFALVCGLFLTPRYDHYMYEGAIVGITFRFIDTISMHTVFGTKLVTSVFVYLGILTLREVALVQEKGIGMRVMQSAVFLFAILYVFTSHIGERHMIPMTFLLYLILLPRITNKKILYIWAAVQFVFGIIYVNHLFHDLSII